MGDETRVQPSRNLAALALFVVLFVAYVATATYDPRISIDVVSATASAWRVAHEHTLDLTGQASWITARMELFNQLVEVDGAAYSGRNPGVIAFGLPAYVLADAIGESSEMPMWPSALTASAVCAATGVVLHSLFRRLTGSRAALIATLLFAFATGTWSVSADGLWGHGPAQLLLVLGMLAMANDRLASSGLFQGAALTVRPYAGFSAAASGIHQAWAARSVVPALRIGAGATLGLGLYLVYTRAVFGVWSPFGGYSTRSYLQSNVIQGQGASNFVTDVFWAFVHPAQGLLLYAPFLLVLVPFVHRTWSHAPRWVRSAFVSGVAFFAAQLYANTWNAGSYFFGYRYPLEFLALSAPMWVLVWHHHVRGDRARTVLFLAAAAIALALQFVGAVIEPYKDGFMVT